MRGKGKIVTVLLYWLLVPCAAGVSADTMLILYKSGRVQAVELDEGADAVKGVSFRKGAAAAGKEGEAHGTRPRPARDGQGKGHPGGKHRPTIEWAPPMDE